MMAPDPFVDDAMRARIESELDRIEREQDVRILLAVESGSRAWRFASPDSDYDVRFIYARRLDDYLSIATPRDVIERPLDAVLDINGWDLRKALQLMAKSNAVLLEWLSSPVGYRHDEAARQALRALAIEAADLPALAFHYDRVARNAWSPGDGTIRLKSCFYALRPCLALRWIAARGTPPPMDLPHLIEGVSLPPELPPRIEALLELKARSGEAAMVEREPVLERFLAETLSVPTPLPGRSGGSAFREHADVLFRRLVTP